MIVFATRRQKTIARLSRRLFYANLRSFGQLGYVSLTHGVGQSPLTGKARDEPKIFFGFCAPNTVIQGRDMQLNIEPLMQGAEDVGERNRIDPAGDGDYDLLTRLQQVMLADVSEYFFFNHYETVQSQLRS